MLMGVRGGGFGVAGGGWRGALGGRDLSLRRLLSAVRRALC